MNFLYFFQDYFVFRKYEKNEVNTCAVNSQRILDGLLIRQLLIIQVDPTVEENAGQTSQKWIRVWTQGRVKQNTRILL